MGFYLADTFTGTNGDPPNGTNWDYYGSAGSSVAIQGNRMRMQLDGDQSDSTTFQTQSDHDADTDIYFDIVVNSGSSGADMVAEIYFRSTDIGSFSGGYILEYVLNNGGYNLWRAPSSSGWSLLGTDTSGGTAASGDTIHFHLRTAGTSIQVTTWINADSEPGSPTISVTDSNKTSAGRWGILVYSNNAGGTPYYELDNVVIGVAGAAMAGRRALNVPHMCGSRTRGRW